MKIYLASSWRNEQQPEAVEILRKASHEVYDFRNPSMGPGAGGRGFHWSEIDPNWQSWTPEQYAGSLYHRIAEDGFASDKMALDWCDACVLLLPCGRSAHLEFGYAVGRDKLTVIVLAQPFEPELIYAFADAVCPDIEDALHFLETVGEGTIDLPEPPPIRTAGKRG